ncbi:hypothetical protein GPM19_10690 [Halomonas sp. ZH2S]|uniref:Peptidase inhibitor I78 family protein n=1 Tax=Vreelandella zhuhanensis TaxID=2684210 RepID=A0A7X3H385_9GAMM|nr:I78 family peptidase inhibitor [Halomonas zhuhanensis]MWJ28660.1 hypothetical protein [Halomonas zhuhanensis]
MVIPRKVALQTAGAGLALILTACTTAQMPPAPSAPKPAPLEESAAAEQEPCDTEAVQDEIGRTFSENDAQGIKQQSGANQVRVLRPGEAATMDHRPDRLNIHLNERDEIIQLRCG